MYRFVEERLGLLWRAWLTKHVTSRYLDRRTYLKMKEAVLEIRNDGTWEWRIQTE